MIKDRVNAKTIQKFWPVTFRIEIKTLICRILLWNFIHEVKSIITFEFSDNYSGIQQNSTCNDMESAQIAKCMWSSRDCICSNFCLTTHLLNASIKRKTGNISTIVRRITTAERARTVGMLQQYVSIALSVCIGHGSLNAEVRNAWRPEND